LNNQKRVFGDPFEELAQDKVDQLQQVFSRVCFGQSVLIVHNMAEQSKARYL